MVLERGLVGRREREGEDLMECGLTYLYNAAISTPLGIKASNGTPMIAVYIRPESYKKSIRGIKGV